MITPKLVEIYEKDLEVLDTMRKYGLKADTIKYELQYHMLVNVIKDLKSLESYVLWMEEHNKNLAEIARFEKEKRDKENATRVNQNSRGFSKFK